MPNQTDNISHDYLRYANCWEDAEILIGALDIQPTDQILSIGSAGDNSFSMLTSDPKSIVAVDINPIQLHLISLKKAAFTALDYEDFLAFLGFTISENRIALYERVRQALASDAISYWDEHISQIENGMIHQGKFERYFHFFQRKILPFAHSKNDIEKLFEAKDKNQQKSYYDTQWNNKRWRLIFHFFFSKFIMGYFGRDRAFMKEVKVPVSQFILDQAQLHLSDMSCQTNHFLYYIMTGQFGKKLPHYARKENFRIIKSRVDRLTLHEGYVQDALELKPEFNKFNLSNIFEYMSTSQFNEVSQQIISKSTKDSKYAYWNLMVTREMSHISMELIQNPSISSGIQDKGFFYKKFITESKQ